MGNFSFILSYNQSISFVNYPGGVECSITIFDENNELVEYTGFQECLPDEIEAYNIGDLTRKAYARALASMEGMQVTE